MLKDAVACGFPSPAANHVEKTLDINELIVKSPAATFFMKASGSSMQDAGIFDGDVLVVDRSLTPKTNDVVIAAVHGELTVKRLVLDGEDKFLASENSETNIRIQINEGVTFWGVVTFVIHGFRKAVGAEVEEETQSLDTIS